MSSSQPKKHSPPGASTNTAATEATTMAQNNVSSEREATEFVAKEMAQAFKDIARGEEAAAMIEANLTALERKLDDILAAYDGVETDANMGRDASAGNDKPTNNQSTERRPNGTS